MVKGIRVIKPSPELLSELGVEGWSPWSCESTAFDWHYDGTETCFVREGRVTVETSEGTVDIGPGDLVQFDDGLDCRWVVHEPIRKVFSFAAKQIEE